MAQIHGPRLQPADIRAVTSEYERACVAFLDLSTKESLVFVVAVSRSTFGLYPLISPKEQDTIDGNYYFPYIYTHTYLWPRRFLLKGIPRIPWKKSTTCAM